jgi:hypothetical protein
MLIVLIVLIVVVIVLHGEFAGGVVIDHRDDLGVLPGPHPAVEPPDAPSHG